MRLALPYSHIPLASTWAVAVFYLVTRFNLVFIVTICAGSINSRCLPCCHGCVTCRRVALASSLTLSSFLARSLCSRSLSTRHAPRLQGKFLMNSVFATATGAAVSINPESLALARSTLSQAPNFADE